MTQQYKNQGTLTILPLLIKKKYILTRMVSFPKRIK